jgi:hypothetical protein
MIYMKFAKDLLETNQYNKQPKKSPVIGIAYLQNIFELSNNTHNYIKTKKMF